MIILDVREKEEFEAERIPEAIFCPLSQIDLLAPGILQNLKDNDVMVICRSGKRSQLALPILEKYNSLKLTLSSYEGGMIRWKEQNKPVIGEKSIFPIMRQVHLVAAGMVFFAFLGAHFINASFIYLALLVGVGLSISGVTGHCPMVFLLQKMPWNQAPSCCSSEAKTGSCCN
ncbi:MAG: hypothetical protein A2X86_21210 [Bdellovibrionales bacterium GWA2_49_15]|nr:MAG: hypothetical protein A2X86_21210 [Bdellovibrionales bacterium GWA2_49_15]HAZ14898.1 hypothetical protein [Bdellovibrionales bacterium]